MVGYITYYNKKTLKLNNNLLSTNLCQIGRKKVNSFHNKYLFALKKKTNFHRFWSAGKDSNQAQNYIMIAANFAREATICNLRQFITCDNW